MECMLLPDGTVLLYECIQFAHEVREEMQKQGAVGYYWRRDDENWLFIHADEEGTSTCPTIELPAPIKLIAMLE